MKVYVSSTFRDLRQHRLAIDRTLRKMGHDVIGMEQYAAEGSRPVERCKRDVALADAYVLILGWRYGYVPADDNPDLLSITEIEYRHALDNGKTVLAFLLDPESPWPPSAMDSASIDATAAAGIERLRSEVGSDFLAGMFTSPDDLASQVAAAVASFGLTKPLSELVLNRTAVSAEAMKGFGTGGPLHDTSLHEIQTMIAQTGKDRALVVHLGDGDTWWSTRLFLLASLLRSLTLVRQIAFTGRDGRFAGMASPDALLDGLSARFRVLDVVAQRLRASEPTEDRLQETDRQIAIWNTVFTPPGARPPGRASPAGRRPPAAPAPGPAAAAATPPVSEQQAHVGVREELLHGWLGERLITRCIEVRGGLTMPQVQQIVDCLVPDVPMEQISAADVPTQHAHQPSPAASPEKVQIKVVDRDAFALELAREWVRAGLPRSPSS